MPARLAPATAALLVMDYQPSILGFLGDPAPLVSVARGAIDTMRSRRGRIVFVRVAFTEQDYAAFPEDSVMGNRVKAGRPNLDADAATTAVHPGLDPRPDDLVVRKTRVGAFATTGLDRQLTNAGITSVVLAGVHTSGVVLTTVREAHDLDYGVVVLADACADPDADVHDFLVERIFPKQGQVITTAELPVRLGRAPGAGDRAATP